MNSPRWKPAVSSKVRTCSNYLMMQITVDRKPGLRHFLWVILNDNETHIFEVFLHDPLQRKWPLAPEHRCVPHGGSGQHDRRGAGRLPELLDVAIGLHQIQRTSAAQKTDLMMMKLCLGSGTTLVLILCEINLSCLLGDDGDGNSPSDGLDVIAVDRMSGTLLFKPKRISQTSNTNSVTQTTTITNFFMK